MVWGKYYEAYILLLGQYDGGKIYRGIQGRLRHEVIPFEQEFVEKDYDTDYLKNLVSFVRVNENVSFFLSSILFLSFQEHVNFLTFHICHGSVTARVIRYTPIRLGFRTILHFFDKMQAERFKNVYPKTNIYYLPGACDPVRFANNIISDED